MLGLEYACFPLPSEIILPFIGSLAYVQGYNLVGVILLSVIVSYFGCLVCYLLGYYGGVYLYNKIYKKFTRWRKGMDLANDKFNKYGGVSVLMCRLVPLCRTYISFFAGIFKQSLLKYSFFSVIGIIIWNSILICGGYALADKWELISKYYDNYKAFFLVLLIIIIGFILWYKKSKKEKNINGD